MSKPIPEMLDCVFCESEVVTVGRLAAAPHNYQGCCQCGASGPEKPTVDEAVAAWNKRVGVEK